MTDDTTPAEAAWHVYRKSDAAYEARPAFDAGYEAGAARAAAAERKRWLAQIRERIAELMQPFADELYLVPELERWADLLAAQDTP